MTYIVYRKDSLWKITVTCLIRPTLAIIRIKMCIRDSLHTVDLRFRYVVELCSDTETFAVRHHLDGIADAVDHAVVCVIEQSELKFNHVSVLGIESVSYTHLDVYKRQMSHSPILRIAVARA